MDRRRIFLILILMAAPMWRALCQDDSYRRAFNAFTTAARNSHSAFGDSVNTAFADAISQNWERFRLCEGERRETAPQPLAAPVATLDDAVSGGQLAVSRVVDIAHSGISTEAFSIFRQNRDAGGLKNISFNFYDVEQKLPLPLAYNSLRLSGISEREVGDFWLRLSKEDYSAITAKCEENRRNCGHNDWAILEWVQGLSGVLFPGDLESERAVFSVFIMNQMGLKSRIARIDGSLVGLFAAAQPVYARKFAVIDTYRYYLVDADVPDSQLYTYSVEFRSDARPLDLKVSSSLQLGKEGDTETRQFNSTVFGCSLSVPINGARVKFYNSYPQTGINVYAASEPDKIFSDAVLDQLKLKLYVLDDLERVNALLRFLQYDFKYEVDSSQFGIEKQFFCEENFFYSANDCEDRAVLFAYLARHLVTDKVVLLEYGDHVAAAVRLSGDIKGHYVRLNDGKYYVCDPTYIGACAGMCIPKYAGSVDKVYRL